MLLTALALLSLSLLLCSKCAQSFVIFVVPNYLTLRSYLLMNGLFTIRNLHIEGRLAPPIVFFVWLTSIHALKSMTMLPIGVPNVVLFMHCIFRIYDSLEADESVSVTALVASGKRKNWHPVPSCRIPGPRLLDVP